MAAVGSLRVAWEGDFTRLHSLAIVNRAICRLLIDRGHDVRRIGGSARPDVEPAEMGGRQSRLLLPESHSFRGAKGDNETQDLRGAKGDNEKRDLRGANGDTQTPDFRRAKGDGETRSFRGAKGDNQGRPQVHIRHEWPPRLEPPQHGRWVLMQPWEYGSLPRAWLPMFGHVDEVWEYSRYVRDCYLDAGVSSDRVHVVPLGIDPEVFRPGCEPLPRPPGRQIRFLFVGGTIFRKGIDVLLRAFARAFSDADGVGLVIKEMGSRSFYRGQTAGLQVAELRERGYPVEYIDRTLSQAEVARLYSACDCLVHPFRGEGFALPVVEAMACGLPLIVTGAGPALDYASDETAYLIPANRGQFAECHVGEIETIGRPWLFEPDADVLVELLKRVAGDLAGARAKGVAASAHIRGHLTRTKTADAVERRLLALVGTGQKRSLGERAQWGGDVMPDPIRTIGKPISRKAAKPAKKTHRERPALAAPPGPDVEQPRSGAEGCLDRFPAHVLPRLSPFAPSRLCVSPPKVSLTMIVRNEEANLPHCLASVKGLFHEIVVVDTGSKDRTPEIAREFGARVFDFVWVDDFAAARNAALALATGDYAFWLHADDVLDPPQRVRLERLIADLRPSEQAAHVVKCACDPGPDGSGGDTVVDHIRLFPVGENVRCSYRVHEQILPALKRARVPVRWTDLTVRHTGYTDRALRLRKLDRDAKILHEELTERPDDPFVLFNLGSIAIERRDWREALDHLRHSLAESAPTDSITRKLYALIARSHQMLGEHQLALAACATGLTFDPDDAELLFRQAIVRRQIRDNDGAERCWRRILTLRRPDRFASVDQGIYGHLTRRNLAVLARERGDHAEAANRWRAVLAECPSDREAQHHLGSATTG